jgi:hypothetical protein
LESFLEKKGLRRTIQRQAIIEASPVPIGTVPIYEAVTRVRRIEDLTIGLLLEVIEEQAEQGVDYMTIHAGVLREFLPLLHSCVTFVVVGPLALFGMLLFLPRWRLLLPLYAASLSYIGVLVLFYVRGRYRLSLVPLLILFAAAAVDRLFDAMRKRRRKEAAALLGAVFLTAIFVNRTYCDPSHAQAKRAAPRSGAEAHSRSAAEASWQVPHHGEAPIPVT